MPALVNAQIVDSITTTQSATVGQATSMAMGMFFQAESQAFAIGLQNAVTSQRGIQQVGEALTATACALMLKSIASPAAP